MQESYAFLNLCPWTLVRCFLQPASREGDKIEDLDMGTVEDKTFAEL